MDVQFLHTGEPVVVIEEGDGEPGEFVTDGTGRKVWTVNADYKPAKVVRLGPVEDVEQGQIAGASYDDTATAKREAAIADGSHPATQDVQYVHDPQGADTPNAGGSPQVSGPVGVPPTQTQLTDADRAELEQRRAGTFVAGGEAKDNADVEGRSTTPAAEDTTT